MKVDSLVDFFYNSPKMYILASDYLEKDNLDVFRAKNSFCLGKFLASKHVCIDGY